MIINIATVIILIIIGNILTGFFMVAYHFNRHDAPCKKTFIVAKALQSLGFLLLLLRDYVPDVLSTLVGNLLLISSVMFESWSLIQLKRPFKGLLQNSYFIGALISIISFITVYFWLNTEANRIFIFSFAVAMMLTGTIFTYFLGKNRTWLEIIIAAMHLTVFLFLSLRAFNAYFAVFDYSIFSIHWFNQVTFVLLFSHMMTVNVGFILLSKQKTDNVLLEAATIDQLTQVTNRQTFLEHSKKFISKASENKLPVSLLMFDIDNFKDINDTYGHMVGDRVLTEMAFLIKQTINQNQVFGRFGGDEFASIMLGLDEKDSNYWTESVFKLITTSTFTDHHLSLSVSIGVVTFIPEKDTTFDTFYRLADEGLYAAKNANKSNWKRAYLQPPEPNIFEDFHV